MPQALTVDDDTGWSADECEEYLLANDIARLPADAVVVAFLCDVLVNAELPKNWVEVRDEMGRMYFHKLSSAETTTCQHPYHDGMQQLAQACRLLLDPDIDRIARTEKVALYCDEWSRVCQAEELKTQDDWATSQSDQGVPFYGHRESQERQWVNPCEVVQAHFRFMLNAIKKLTDDSYISQLRENAGKHGLWQSIPSPLVPVNVPSPNGKPGKCSAMFGNFRSALGSIRRKTSPTRSLSLGGLRLDGIKEETAEDVEQHAFIIGASVSRWHGMTFQWTAQECLDFVRGLGILTLPADGAIEQFLLDAIAEATPPRPWITIKGQDNKLCFRNEATDEVTMMHPLQHIMLKLAGACRACFNLASVERYAQIRSLHESWFAEAEAAREKWARKMSTSKNRPFHYHKDTHETTWEDPSAIVLPEFQVRLAAISRLVEDTYVERLKEYGRRVRNETSENIDTSQPRKANTPAPLSSGLSESRSSVDKAIAQSKLESTESTTTTIDNPQRLGQGYAEWTDDEAATYISRLECGRDPAVARFLQDVLMGAALPPPWISIRNPSNQVVFKNGLTQEIVHEHPLHSALPALASACKDCLSLEHKESYNRIKGLHELWTAEASRAITAWQYLEDKAKGRNYYLNSETGERRWDSPSDGIFAAAHFKLAALGHLVDSGYITRLRTVAKHGEKLSRVQFSAQSQIGTSDASLESTSQSMQRTRPLSVEAQKMRVSSSGSRSRSTSPIPAFPTFSTSIQGERRPSLDASLVDKDNARWKDEEVRQYILGLKVLSLPADFPTLRFLEDAINADIEKNPWVGCRHDSGKLWFYNTRTMAKSQKHPYEHSLRQLAILCKQYLGLSAGLRLKQIRMQRDNWDAEAKANLDAWVRKMSRTKNKEYFQHRETSETQWQNPAAEIRTMNNFRVTVLDWLLKDDYCDSLRVDATNGDSTNRRSSNADSTCSTFLSDNDEAVVAAFVYLTIENLMLDALTADESLCTKFKAKVKQSIAQEAGKAVRPQQVMLSLLNGSSVKVEATVKCAATEQASVQSSLSSSTALSREVVQSVRTLPGIEHVSKGFIEISSLRIETPQQRSRTEQKRSEKEQQAQLQRETERHEAAQRAEQQRLEREELARLQRERHEVERAEQQRLEREELARLQRERHEVERAEQERLAEQQVVREAQRAEQERLAREQLARVERELHETEHRAQRRAEQQEALKIQRERLERRREEDFVSRKEIDALLEKECTEDIHVLRKSFLKKILTADDAIRKLEVNQIEKDEEKLRKEEEYEVTIKSLQDDTALPSSPSAHEIQSALESDRTAFQLSTSTIFNQDLVTTSTSMRQEKLRCNQIREDGSVAADGALQDMSQRLLIELELRRKIEDEKHHALRENLALQAAFESRERELEVEASQRAEGALELRRKIEDEKHHAFRENVALKAAFESRERELEVEAMDRLRVKSDEAAAMTKTCTALKAEVDRAVASEQALHSRTISLIAQLQFKENTVESLESIIACLRAEANIDNDFKNEAEMLFQQLELQETQQAYLFQQEGDVCRKAKDELHQAWQENADLSTDIKQLQFENERRASLEHMSRSTWEMDMAAQQQDMMSLKAQLELKESAAESLAKINSSLRDEASKIENDYTDLAKKWAQQLLMKETEKAHLLQENACANDRAEKEGDLCRKTKEELNQALWVNEHLTADIERAENGRETQAALENMRRSTWEMDMAAKRKEDVHLLRVENEMTTQIVYENTAQLLKAEQMEYKHMMQQEMQLLRQDSERVQDRWKAEQSMWRAEFKQMEEEVAMKTADQRRQLNLEEEIKFLRMENDKLQLQWKAEQSLWREEFRELQQKDAVQNSQQNNAALEARKLFEENFERTTRFEQLVQLAVDKQESMVQSIVSAAKQEGLPSAVQEQLKNILVPVSGQIKDLEQRFTRNSSEVADARAVAEDMRCRLEAELVTLKKLESDVERSQENLQKAVASQSMRDAEAWKSQRQDVRKMGDDILKLVMQKIDTQYKDINANAASQIQHQQLLSEIQQAKTSELRASELLQAKDLEYHHQELLAKAKLEHIQQRHLYEEQESERLKERYNLEYQSMMHGYRQAQMAWRSDDENEEYCPRRSSSVDRNEMTKSNSKLSLKLRDAVLSGQQYSAYNNEMPNVRRLAVGDSLIARSGCRLAVGDSLKARSARFKYNDC